MNDTDEWWDDYLAHLREQKERELSKHRALIENFRSFCLEKGVELNDDCFQYIPKIGIVAEHPNIVMSLTDVIQPDKEQLVDFKALETSFERKHFAHGYFYTDRFMLMAHPYFRRSYSGQNHFSPRFIDLFWDMNIPGVTKHIAMDLDRLRIDVDNQICIEADTWFGPKFKNDISKIDEGAVKMRPPLDISRAMVTIFFDSTYSLDIKWELKDEIMSFQAEEIKYDDVILEGNDGVYHPAKYAHAEFDLNGKYFRHFDGAIHFYTHEEYCQRQDQDLNFNQKNNFHMKPVSKKLFKINGPLTVEKWMEMLGHYLTGDPLVHEYFEGQMPNHVNEAINKFRERQKPCT